VNSRNRSLDVLRGIAILLVLGRHFNYFPLWRQAGWIGVDLFIVLSGFLISGLLFQEYKNTGKLDVRRFILRRGLKIWPSYYLLILATMLFYVFIARASERLFQNMRLQSPHCSSGTISVLMASTFLLTHGLWQSRSTFISYCLCCC